MTRQELIDQWKNAPEKLGEPVTATYPAVRSKEPFVTSSIVDLAEDGGLIIDGDNIP